MMNCRKVESLVTDYLDGVVEGITRLRFELHLRICPSCSRYVSKVQKLIEALGRLPANEPVSSEKIAKLQRIAAKSADFGGDPERSPQS